MSERGETAPTVWARALAAGVPEERLHQHLRRGAVLLDGSR
ncbi:hypothetical protein [Pseudonocardia sp. NPDC049635]